MRPAIVTGTMRWKGLAHRVPSPRSMPTTKAAAAVVPAEVERRRTALRRLMSEHGAVIYGYCARMVQDDALAADVHQQVFEQAYRDLDALRDEANARSWLFGIAQHRCLDALKARRRRESRVVPANDDDLDAVAATEPEAWEQIDAARRAEALDACVRRLSPESRTAVLLRFQEGMTYEHMSRICREKPATLQARVARAMPLLRKCLERKGVEA